MDTNWQDYQTLKEIRLGNKKKNYFFQRMCRHDKKGDFYWRNQVQQKSGPVTTYNLFTLEKFIFPSQMN